MDASYARLEARVPKLNLGRVVGRDGGFGNIDTVYLNDGGDPRVTVEASGVDSAKDFRFTFANLVRDAATADEVEQIAAGDIVQSSNVITVGVMSSIWSKIKAAFAPKAHTHSGVDIEDGTITKAKLDKSLGDSLSREKIAIADRVFCDRIGKSATLHSSTHIYPEPVNGWIKLGSLPQSWRPADGCYCAAEMGGLTGRAYVGPNGDILVSPPSGYVSTSSICFSLPFLIC